MEYSKSSESGLKISSFKKMVSLNLMLCVHTYKLRAAARWWQPLIDTMLSFVTLDSCFLHQIHLEWVEQWMCRPSWKFFATMCLPWACSLLLSTENLSQFLLGHKNPFPPPKPEQAPWEMEAGWSLKTTKPGSSNSAMRLALWLLFGGKALTSIVYMKAASRGLGEYSEVFRLNKLCFNKHHIMVPWAVGAVVTKN